MKSYLRFLLRNKLYTSIQFIGLSVSLAFVFIISCYVWQNLAVTRHYPDTDNIYLVGLSNSAGSGYLYGSTLQNHIPEIIDHCLVVNSSSDFKMGNGQKVEESDELYVDQNFWNFFETRFIYGSPEIFNDKSNVAVTEKFAKAHGGLDIIGEKLIDGKREFTIAGIVRWDDRSIFAMDGAVILSAANINAGRQKHAPLSVATGGTLSFIKVIEGCTEEELLTKIDSAVVRENPESFLYKGQSHYMSVCPFNELYFSDLNDSEDYDGLKKGQKGVIISFSIIVLFLLLSAILNYVNLCTALSGKRAKELATRMLLGDSRMKIFGKLVLESVLLVLASMAFAFALAIISIDGMNALLNSPVPLKFSFEQEFIYIYLGICFLTSVLCAIIPAANCFNLKPVEIIKGEHRYRSKKGFSKVFIAIQNILSLTMIAIALVISLQLRHMINMPLNSNIDNICYINIAGQTDNLKNKLSELPYIKRVAKSNGYPGSRYMGVSMPINPGEEVKVMGNFNIIQCDSAAFEMYDFEIIHRFGIPKGNGIWLTESGFRELEIDYDNPSLPKVVGMFLDKDSMQLAGVIKDIPFGPALNYDPKSIGIVNVVTSAPKDNLIVETFERNAEIEKELASIVKEEARIQANGGYEFSSTKYVKDLLMEPYEKSKKQNTLILIFTLISIMLSVLGQIAMSTYYANEKEKDIALHKIFGSSIRSEVARALKTYMVLCCIAIVIAVPLSIYIAKIYLSGFTYRMELGAWIFIIATLACLGISFCSVITQLTRAARTNPAEALKKE